MADVVERLHDHSTRINGLPLDTESAAVMRAAIAEIKTLRARLSQAGAGGVVDEHALDEARKAYNASLLSDGGAFGATERIVKAYLAALAPSPSAGEPRAWIANDPEGGPYLTWSAKAAASYPDPIALYATPPASVQTASAEAIADLIDSIAKCHSENAMDRAFLDNSEEIAAAILLQLNSVSLSASPLTPSLAEQLEAERGTVRNLHEELQRKDALLASLSPAPTQGDGA